MKPGTIPQKFTMTNALQTGDVIDYDVPNGQLTVSGGVVVMGATAGVAATTNTPGQRCAVYMRGVFELPKTAGAALAQGAKVYWDAGAGVVTATAAGNTALGFMAYAAIAAATKAAVNLRQF